MWALGAKLSLIGGVLVVLAACQTTGSTASLSSAAKKPDGPVPITAMRLALGHEDGSLKDVTPKELPPPSPENLLGLSPARLAHALGQPDFQRNDRNAAIWQYAGPTCFLDLYLYKKRGAPLAVSHYEFRSRNVEKVDKKACFSSVLAHHYGKRG